MGDLANNIWIETLKARRSRLPLLSGAAYLFIAPAIGLLMYVAMHPEFAREIGLLRAKADLAIGAADWPTYLGILAQATAVGGMLLFSLTQSWVFGREFADGTLKDLLATPTPRPAVLAAKYLVWGAWSLGMAAASFLAGLVVGTLLGLPGGSAVVFVQGALRIAVTALLTVATLTPVAWLASIGRGYLLPLGAAFGFLVSAQIATVLGWGNYYPWAIPAVYSGFRTGAVLEAGSYIVVALTALAGVLGVNRHWNSADLHQ